MKLCRLVFILLLCFSLISGCAYIQGRKDDQQQAAAMKKSTNPAAQQISPEGVSSQPSTTPNPSSTASKMLAPLTQ